MHWVVFYDGECGLCSCSVRLLARFDTRERISFATLQGGLAGESGLHRHAANHGGTVVVMREPDGKLFFRSDAVLELTKALGGIWRCLGILAVIPRAWRDTLYRFVADRRHLWVRKNASCDLPDERLSKRLRE